MIKLDPKPGLLISKTLFIAKRKILKRLKILKNKIKDLNNKTTQSKEDLIYDCEIKIIKKRLKYKILDS